jgi:mycofactocin precursor
MQPQVRSTTTTTEVENADATDVARPVEEELVLDELLVEDVSIDGMCGVY